MSYYIGILDGSGSTWGIRIPDCPGAFGAGNSAETAFHNAIEGLAAWAEATLKDGDELPHGRSLSEIVASPEDGPASGETIVMLPLVLDSGRTVRANLTFDAGLLSAIDAEATRRGLTRSAFLASAAREKLGSI